FWLFGIVRIMRKITRDVELKLAVEETYGSSGHTVLLGAASAARIGNRLFAHQLRIKLSSALEVCGSTSRIPFLLLHHRAIVVGACVIRFQFYRACIIGNGAIPLVSLCPGVAAVVVSSGIGRAEFNRFGVVGNRASRVILQPFGLGAVIVRGVIFWIRFDRA